MWIVGYARRPSHVMGNGVEMVHQVESRWLRTGCGGQARRHGAEIDTEDLRDYDVSGRQRSVP